MALVGRNMRAGYRGRAVLRSVDLSLEPGEFLCVLGPNGAGKSTLARCLVGLLAGGEVSLDGQELLQWNSRQRAQRIGFLPQEVEPGFSFLVEDAVALGARVAGQRDDGAIESALTAVDAQPLRHRKLAELSGGERRRVLLASVLAQQPRYLVLDEPTAMLDLEHQASIFRCVRERADAGLGALVVTHDLNLAARFADRLLLLRDGELVASGAPREVLQADVLRQAFGDHFELIETAGQAPVVLPR